MNILENTITDKDIITEKRKKANPYIYKNVEPELMEKHQNLGWEFDRKLKHTVKIKKLKSVDVLFEDRVWVMLSSLGFKRLNKDRNFKVPYDKKGLLTQQIDVFAADDETVLFVECKATKNLKKGDFKNDIEAIGGKRGGIIAEIRKCFPAKKYKIKFIFATSKYILSEQDTERLKKFDIIHFDEDAIQYYEELGKHLGQAARFQLLGTLFEGQKIPSLDNKIPAIEGSMGGFKYYSFSIEPEKILKMGYVLHSDNANKNDMPSYQRLIKKNRLKSIQEFVNKGGFFPNSVIINIVANGSNLRFDKSSLQSECSLSKLGLLYLPKKYRSVFIIDGQHRLYGYADSEYINKNTIPVVAFIDLDKREQVRLFMEINENQKSVSKNLRNTLIGELSWDDDDLNKQRKALCSLVARELGEDTNSPLYGRVIIGENKKTSKRCISMESITSSLIKSNFFSKFKDDSIIADGTFDKGNNDVTKNNIMIFLIKVFKVFSGKLKEEWEKGEEDNGILTINIGIYGLISIFSDIVDYLVKESIVNPKVDSSDIILTKMSFFLEPLVHFYKNITEKSKTELRKTYGGGGKTKYWRSLQKAIHDKIPEFKPEGLDQYWLDHGMHFNVDSYKMLREIESYFNIDFKDKLKSKYGEQWFALGVPKSVYFEAKRLAAEKDLENASTGEVTDPWDCLMLINYREIAIVEGNWAELFSNDYTRPEERRKNGNKKIKTEWLEKLNKIRNKVAHNNSVTGEEYEFLKSVYNWKTGKSI